MRLLCSVVLVAAVLLLSDTIGSSDAATVDWSWSNPLSFSSDKKKDDEPAVPKPEAAALQQNPGGKDEEGGSNADPLAEEDDYDANNNKAKFAIDEEGEDIKTINSLPEPGQTNFQAGVAVPVSLPVNQSTQYQYDRYPQQSEFVDNAPHPTQSQGPDPRFARPRACQEGQYLCRKASPQQEHIRCIPNEWKCNGVRDCEENDDEDNCAINNFRPQPAAQCHESQHTCYGSGINGLPVQCLNRDKICNGVYDCQYGDDEANDHCGDQYARRATESTIPQPQPPVQNAPPIYQPQPSVQPQPAPPHQQCPEPNTRSDEQFKRLEWTDRCIRSCLSNNRH